MSRTGTRPAGMLLLDAPAPDSGSTQARLPFSSGQLFSPCSSTSCGEPQQQLQSSAQRKLGPKLISVCNYLQLAVGKEQERSPAAGPLTPVFVLVVSERGPE